MLFWTPLTFIIWTKTVEKQKRVSHTGLERHEAE